MQPSDIATNEPLMQLSQPQFYYNIDILKMSSIFIKDLMSPLSNFNPNRNILSWRFNWFPS